MAEEVGVIADIGGTNARFALCSKDGTISGIRNLKSCDYTSLEKAYLSYLEQAGCDRQPKAAAICIPGIVAENRLKVANLNWDSDIMSAWERLDLDYLTIINDLAAQALAIPLIPDSRKVKIGTGGVSVDASPMAVIAPGTGLGVSCLVPEENSYMAIPAEGGHATAAAMDDETEGLIRHLRGRFGHVSYERLISGQGIENIYEYLSGDRITAEKACAKAVAGDGKAKRAFELFFTFLASFAGNAALMYGAMGGVYLLGGILNDPDVAKMFGEFDFRREFENKGRISAWYLKDIAVYRVTEENPGLSGLSTLIKDYFKNSA